MNENKNKCKVLGFKQYTDKNSGEEMVRIIITVENDDEEYTGLVPVCVFLKQENNILYNLKNAYNEKKDVYYKTRENIATGKTKVVSMEF